MLTGQALKEEALFTSKSGKTALNILIFKHLLFHNQWRTQEFCSGGVQQIQLRTEDRENGDLGVVVP